uniref:Uncharacterized protein n=1 Tax=Meloidogyne hapla TaxID=6305 RepID=A0A1I8C1W7_MELHA
MFKGLNKAEEKLEETENNVEMGEIKENKKLENEIKKAKNSIFYEIKSKRKIKNSREEEIKKAKEIEKDNEKEEKSDQSTDLTIKYGKMNIKCKNITFDEINIKNNSKNKHNKKDKNCSDFDEISKGIIYDKKSKRKQKFNHNAFEDPWNFENYKGKNIFGEGSSVIQGNNKNYNISEGSTIPFGYIQKLQEYYNNYSESFPPLLNTFQGYEKPSRPAPISFNAPQKNESFKNLFPLYQREISRPKDSQHLNPYAKVYIPLNQQNTQPSFKQFDPFNHPFEFDKIIKNKETESLSQHDLNQTNVFSHNQG